MIPGHIYVSKCWPFNKFESLLDSSRETRMIIQPPQMARNARLMRSKQVRIFSTPEIYPGHPASPDCHRSMGCWRLVPRLDRMVHCMPREVSQYLAPWWHRNSMAFKSYGAANVRLGCTHFEALNAPKDAAVGIISGHEIIEWDAVTTPSHSKHLGGMVTWSNTSL